MGMRRVASILVPSLPWLAYFGLVFVAIWFIGLDTRPDTDTTGWMLLALAVPALFVAAHVSRWERTWIRARFNVELSSRRPDGGGSGGVFDALWP